MVDGWRSTPMSIYTKRRPIIEAVLNRKHRVAHRLEQRLQPLLRRVGWLRQLTNAVFDVRSQRGRDGSSLYSKLIRIAVLFSRHLSRSTPISSEDRDEGMASFGREDMAATLRQRPLH